jgi:hypothetical protein
MFGVELGVPFIASGPRGDNDVLDLDKTQRASRQPADNRNNQANSKHVNPLIFK